jgi:hypothetical protein
MGIKKTKEKISNGERKRSQIFIKAGFESYLDLNWVAASRTFWGITFGLKKQRHFDILFPYQ